jgi:uncharacterized protein YcbK (DUF882 family)
VGSPVPVNYVRYLLAAARRSRTGSCAALAAVLLMLGNQSLENALANGDTRTLTLHHIHTDEDITITFKRNGRYDEEALKKLDWFVRDWRKEEEIHMDPQLFDLIWEVSREVGGESTIHVVCGYRSPSTNEMLRHRSSGVAKFSQHTLGKAMDFYIPGASLEGLRIAGLRMQRGGVGYYPTSGSPFVHLDVGGVRYWPRMSREELARIFPDGRTVYLPSDGHPLPGYALALADIEKRGSNKKNILAALFSKEDEDETSPPAKGAFIPATLAQHATYTVASAESRAEPVHLAAVATTPVPVPVARPARFAALAQAATPPQAAPVPQVRYSLASADPPRPPAPINTAPQPSRLSSAAADVTGSIPSSGVMPWPVREADNDRVPLDIMMAYAEQPRPEEVQSAARSPQPMGEIAAHGLARAAKPASLRENVSMVAKKSAVHTAAIANPPTSAETVSRAKAVAVIANAGMRYDDPWLRAMILAPNLSDSMTATLYGDPDMTELRTLMYKPAIAVAMSFEDDPYPGIAAGYFSGDAVVFPTTFSFQRRTASLR